MSFGSTNQMEFLTDETGSVRWLCFEIEGIDWSYFKEIDIDLVWSQAFALYKSGFNYELSKEEIEENEEMNRKHRVNTPEMELVMKYYKPATKDEHDVFYTGTDFVSNLMDYTLKNIRLSSITIGKALKMLGFPQSQKYTEDSRKKGIILNTIMVTLSRK